VPPALAESPAEKKEAVMISKSKAKVLPQKSGRTFWDRASDEIFADLLTANSCTERIALGEACMGRGLLSASISDALDLIYFLAETVVAAQVAARRYGLKASVLLAIARLHSGYDPADWAAAHGHPVPPGTSALDRMQFIEQSFIEEARYLVTKRSLSLAMLVAGDPAAYFKKLCELGWCEPFELLDLPRLARDFSFADKPVALELHVDPRNPGLTPSVAANAC
jgi:hypothetical protein